MNCENYLCIYYVNGHCTVKKISIDRMGMCQECIYPNIEEDVSNRYKQKLLSKYHDLDEK